MKPPKKDERFAHRLIKGLDETIKNYKDETDAVERQYHTTCIEERLITFRRMKFLGKHGTGSIRTPLKNTCKINLVGLHWKHDAEVYKLLDCIIHELS